MLCVYQTKHNDLYFSHDFIFATLYVDNFPKDNDCTNRGWGLWDGRGGGGEASSFLKFLQIYKKY